MSFSEDQRYAYALGPASVVLDVGAHRGTFTRQISELYGSRVYAFEPVREFREELEALSLENVRVFDFGIGGTDRIDTISVLGDGSSVFREGDRQETIEVRSLERVLDELELRYVDLLKLNVEGCEYEILEHILDRRLADRFEHIQVQFHALVPDAEARRQAIRERLAESHRTTYDVPFVWESHSRFPGRVELGIAAVIRADQTRLEEWIEYHRLVGVQRFWLYDNSPQEVRRQVLEPLVEAGLVELIDWPVVRRGDLIERQLEAFGDVLRRAVGEVRWLALIDLDEFLLPLEDDTVTACLDRRFAGASAVYVNWRNFGTGGVRFDRKEPILGRLTAASDRLHPRNAVGKSILRPEAVRVEHYWNPHHVPLLGGAYANGDGEAVPSDHNQPVLDGKVHDGLLRINHYAHGDEAAFRTTRLRDVSDEWLVWEHYAAFSEEQDTRIIDFLRERHPASYDALWGRPAEEWPECGPYVSAKLIGRLGNNLFEIAAASALAWDNGAEAVFPELSSSSPYESVLRRCDPGPVDRDWVDWQEPSYAYSPIPYQPGIRLGGYYQSERYFAHQRARIVELFAPAPEHRVALRERYGDLLAHPETVAVQLRYYREDDPYGSIYPQYGREYLELASTHFSPSAQFVVSTNNPEFARANLPAQMENAVILDDDDCLELHVLASCRDAIITNSSFGWWAAWLNEHPSKRVVRPAIWVYGLPADDVCPPEWIALDAPIVAVVPS